MSRAKFEGGSMNGQEIDGVYGFRFIALSFRSPEKGKRIRTRETYRREGHNERFVHPPDGPQPHLVFTYVLESIEDWA